MHKMIRLLLLNTCCSQLLVQYLKSCRAIFFTLYNLHISFYSKIPWNRDENGHLTYMYDCSSILYTRTRTVPINVYMLRCVTSRCTLKWNGANDYIYRISQAVCVNEEICWDFVDMVSSMKCNFSAFCFLMNSSYNRHNSARKFISVKTFIRVFFSWASSQCSDFREACNWCGISPKILACDATKIGISASSANVDPVETPKNETPLKIKYRKNNRCFLPYPSNDLVLSVKDRKDEVKKIREARAHMKTIMKSVGICCQNNEVDETFELRNRQLLDVFPTLCKPLLRKVFSQSLSLDQLSTATQLFYAQLRITTPRVFTTVIIGRHDGLH